MSLTVATWIGAIATMVSGHCRADLPGLPRERGPGRATCMILNPAHQSDDLPSQGWRGRATDGIPY
jgi:hypothetical protein